MSPAGPVVRFGNERKSAIGTVVTNTVTLDLLSPFPFHHVFEKS